MRLTWGLLAFLEVVTAADVYAAVAAKKCTDQVGCEGYYRAFAVTTAPANSAFEPVSNVTGLSVAAIGAQSSSAGTVTNGKVDVAGFRFKTPADTSDNNNALSFYFGYLGLRGTWDTSTKSGAVAGALAEVVSALSSVNVWYENDNVTGFKWDVTQPVVTKRWDIFDCAGGERQGYDALDPNGKLELKTLVWTPIFHNKTKCNAIPALSTAPDGCEIHTLTTIGTHTSAPGVPVLTFVARIASQPVLINSVLHGPEFAKFDVRVQFPWAAYTQLYNPTRAKLALISINAGKSGAFAVAAKRDSDADSLVFAASGGQSTSHYAYTNTAQVDGQTGTVTTQVITGKQILDFECPAGSPCAGILGTGTSWVVLFLKFGVNWWQGWGWKASLTIHALGTTDRPNNIFWDPEVGATGANSAAFAVPSFMFLVALMLH